MVRFSRFIDLYASFDEISPKSDCLADYLALQRIPTNNFKYTEIRDALLGRKSLDDVPNANFAPNDARIFEKRFRLMANSDRFFIIASKINPTATELEELAVIGYGWSVLFAVKLYLVDHPDIARAYKGLMPYGAPIKAFVNSLKSRPKEITGSPDLRDHVYLQRISNQMAGVLGVTSVVINNYMYLQGERLISRAAKTDENVE